MPGVVLAVIIALIVSGYLKRRKKKEQAGAVWMGLDHDPKADLEAQMQQLLNVKKETAAG